MRQSLSGKWIEYHVTGDKELFWAWEALDDLVRHTPEQAWQHILSVLAETNSEDVLSNLAAGPLEDLLVLHGPAFIERIEIASREMPDMAKLMAGVWRNNMSDAVWERVHAIQAKYS